MSRWPILRLLLVLMISLCTLLPTGCAKYPPWVPHDFCTVAQPGNKFFVAVHGSVATDDDIFTSMSLVLPGYESTGFTGISGGWVFITGPSVALEYESGLYKHWGDEEYWEFTQAIIGRWNYFPWNHLVYTTVAMGFGMSYTDVLPRRATENNPEVTNLLHFQPVEVTFSLPDKPDLQLVLRLHHRSGGFGIYCPGVATYNSVGLGLRYYF